MASRMRFRYDALNGTNSTRLIKLFPARRQEGGIKIELSEIKLDSMVEYEALSYSWDDQRPTKEVICNDTTLRVTENVFLALRRLRYSKPKQRILWIDAISINQDDETEKSAQVSNMGYIYERATRVNVWLSKASAAMELAFEYLHRTAGPELQFPRIPTNYISEVRDGFHQLCLHPYWTRIWTVQEVALNGNCWIYLGKLKPMSMLSFKVMLYEVEGYLNLTTEKVTPSASEDVYPASFQRGSPNTAIYLHGPLKDISIGDALPLLLSKKAKNPLDLVFACRALFPDSFGQIEVDYTRDLSDILHEASIRIIPRIRNIAELFDLVCHCPPVTSAPSWVLNLQHDLQPYVTTHYWGKWRTKSEFTVPHDGPNTARILPDGKTLCVRGAIIDYVSLVSDEFPHYTLQSQKEWHRDVCSLLRNWKAYTRDDLRHNFVEAMNYILYAAVNAIEDMATQIATAVRLERVQVIDEDGTPLENTVYKIHHVEKSHELGNLSPAAREKQRQTRMSAFDKWMDDPSISSFRLDVEDVLRSTYAESCSSTTCSPALSDRSLFSTAKGRMGLGKSVRSGDAIALISGCELPYVLRAVVGTGRYTLVQPAVVEGVMHGEESLAVETEWKVIQIV